MESLVERFQDTIHSFRKILESGVLQKMGSGITGPQMFVLYYIHQKETCNLKQLAEKMEVKPSAITVMIDRLENAGYVKRIDDPADRRSVLVELTDPGKDVLAKAVSIRNELVSRFLARLEPAEQELVIKLLEKMIEKE